MAFSSSGCQQLWRLISNCGLKKIGLYSHPQNNKQTTKNYDTKPIQVLLWVTLWDTTAGSSSKGRAIIHKAISHKATWEGERIRSSPSAQSRKALLQSRVSRSEYIFSCQCIRLLKMHKRLSLFLNTRSGSLPIPL